MNRTRLALSAVSLGVTLAVAAPLGAPVASAAGHPHTQQPAQQRAHPRLKDVHCGTDRWGGVYAKLPSRWQRDATHSRLLCRWTSPDGEAAIVLRVKAPFVRPQRERLADDGHRYVEYAFKHRSMWGVHAVKWGYAEGAGSDRRRHAVIQAYRMRLEYTALTGHYADHVDQFRRAVKSSGAAG
jgi:hypothetical protein